MYYNYPIYIIRDLLHHKKTMLLFLSITPIFMVFSTIPLDVMPIKTWGYWKDLVVSLRFEFLYAPLIIIMVGSQLKNNEWDMLRKYEKREQIFIYWTSFVLIFSLIFSCVVLISALIINKAADYYLNSGHNSDYKSFLLYQPNNISHNESMIIFFIIFFLLISIIGILYIILHSIFNHKILTALFLITLIIFDRFTFSVIPLCLYLGNQLPLNISLILLFSLILLVIIGYWVSENKDYL